MSFFNNLFSLKPWMMPTEPKGYTWRPNKYSEPTYPMIGRNVMASEHTTARPTSSHRHTVGHRANKRLKV